MSRELFIESDSFEVRTALREDARLVALEREARQYPDLVGAIFHAKVRRVVPGMGSAFLDLGMDRDAFLQLEDLGANRREDIADLISVGEKLLVQVTRDRHGKGPRVTTRIGLAGRTLVLLPMADGVAISNRIIDQETVRGRAESVVAAEEELLGSGWIVRTAGESASRADFESEAQRLITKWQRVTTEYRNSRHPQQLYAEPGLATRALRDESGIDRVVVQGPAAAEVASAVEEWRIQAEVETSDDGPSLFARLGLDDEIERLQKPWVNLASGGSLVIETTEALVSIDVNSGSDVGDGDFEQLALATNLEAVDEIARQLRLRGLGGLIAVDFIDLRQAVHRETLIEHLREAVRDDPQDVRVGSVSRFGLVDLTRRRSQTSYFEQSQRACPTCGGRGKVASIRALRSQIRHHLAGLDASDEVEIRLAPETAERLGDLAEMTLPSGPLPTVVGDSSLAPSEVVWRKR